MRQGASLLDMFWTRFVSPAKQKRDICITFPAASSSALTFLCLGIFSETVRARVMKLGSCIHLEQLRSTLCSILRLDLLLTVH